MRLVGKNTATGVLLFTVALYSYTAGMALGGEAAKGRLTERESRRYNKTGKPIAMMPGPGGAHSWQPMAYNPGTGLVYIPA
jgi:hypothetical protein